jgi:hypothetical protein
MNTPKIKFKPRITRKYIHKGGSEKNSTKSKTYVVFVKEDDTGINAETGNILELKDTTDINTLTTKIKPDTIKAVANLDNEPFEVVENENIEGASGQGNASREGIAKEKSIAIEQGNASREGIAKEKSIAIEQGIASGQGIAIEKGIANEQDNASGKGIANEQGIAIEKGSANEEGNANEKGRPRINSLSLTKRRLLKKKKKNNSRARRSGINLSSANLVNATPINTSEQATSI